MGRIFLCGDTLGHFEYVIQAVQERRPAAIVFLGDLQPQRRLESELQLIHGQTYIWLIHYNHDPDNDADYDDLFGPALA